MRENANVANGMALDHDGALLACEQGTRSQHAAITRVDRATRRAVETLVDGWGGLRLNSPNDVVVKSDGTIWFTDPSYGRLQGFRPEPLVGDYVYRFDPRTGRPVGRRRQLRQAQRPRLLARRDGSSTSATAAPTRRRAATTRPDRITSRRSTSSTGAGSGRAPLLRDHPGLPDGIKVDAEGRVYASASSGVQVLEPGGELIGEISLPGAVNFAFGGPDRNVLFITADDALWAAVLNAPDHRSERSLTMTVSGPARPSTTPAQTPCSRPPSATPTKAAIGS